MKSKPSDHSALPLSFEVLTGVSMHTQPCLSHLSLAAFSQKWVCALPLSLALGLHLVNRHKDTGTFLFWWPHISLLWV